MHIQIKDVTKIYGAQIALNKINLNLSENKIIGLLGPNGAGKSTLMKILTGLVQQDSGEVSIVEAGSEVPFRNFKTKFGYLPENNPLYQHMYVKEYLEWVANLRNLPKESVGEVIEKVRLENEQHKTIQNLSKGYKQRVGIAQAIIHEPDLLLLDEPTNGLDPSQIVEIRNVIKEVGKGKTVLMSTHLMQEVEALCNHVFLLNKGSLIANQSIEEFKGEYFNLEEAFQNSIK